MNYPVVEALGWSIIHSLWQCCIVALLFTVFNLLVRSANARYVAGCVALVLMLAAPAVTFLTMFQDPESVTALPASAASVPDAAAQAETPLVTAVSPSAAPSYLTMTVWLWLTGVIAMTAWSAAGWIYAQRLKWRSKHATPEVWQGRLSALASQLHMHRTVRLYESVLAQVPAVIGWIRPVILIPAGALINLSAQELEAVLAHELAHIRRYDYLVNLLQTVIETLVFYHPAVWWVGRRIRAEREHCCDDLAVQACGDRLVYARALTSLEELRCGNATFAMAATGGELSSRIRRLFGARQPARRLLPFWLLAAFPILLSTLLFVNTRAAQADNPSTMSETTPEAALAQPAPEAVAPRAPQSPAPATAPAGLLAPAMPAPAMPAPAMPAPALAGPTTPAAAPALAPAEPGNITSPLALAPDAGRIREMNLLVEKLHRLASQMPKNNREVELLVHQMQQLQAEIPQTLAQVAPPAPAHHGEGYLAGLADAGYTNISVDEIIDLKNNGVNPDYIKSMLHAGFGVLNPKELIKLKTYGVAPEYAQAVKSSGIRDADVEGVIKLHQNGVRPELLEALGAAGYKDVSVAQAIQAQTNGLSGAALRSLREQGFKNLTLEQVIKLKRAGVI